MSSLQNYKINSLTLQQKQYNMKKIILILLTAFVLTSCVTGTKLIPSTAPADNKAYTVLKEDKTSTVRNRIWLLFIPITIGPKSEETREERCLKRVLKQNNADGIVTGRYIHRKIVIPLIFVTYSWRSTTLLATPFKLNTDTLKK